MRIRSIKATIERALKAAGVDAESMFTKAPKAFRQALATAGFTPVRGRPARRSSTSPAGRATPASPRRAAAPAWPGQFSTHRVARGMTSRSYKLYVPSTVSGPARPLVVMLHGCKQDPDDFARGTRMNELAERHGFLVAYPAQSRLANGANCWNWFNVKEQGREGDEPALIAAMVAEIAARHDVDQDRVFVAGLSAGAAMAVILGATYPEVFRAIGAHSGLPHQAANDVGSAFSAMRGRLQAGAAATAATPVPTIVFHGDADHTVAVSNGQAIVQSALRAFEQTPGVALARQPDQALQHGGRAATVSRYLDASGRVQVEDWTVRGAGHAWSGGSDQGSFADPAGPDASSEMLRFFLQR